MSNAKYNNSVRDMLRLRKRVKSFASRNKGCSTVLITVQGNMYKYVGSPWMCQHFAQLQEVERAAKAAHKIPMSSADIPTEEIRLDSTLIESLQMHCFEMRVGDMRAILAQAAGPPDTADSRKGRRGWFRNERNMPDWWRAAGLPWQSPCHPRNGRQRFREQDLWCLIEHLQARAGINVPLRSDVRANYRSLFSTATVLEERVAEGNQADYDDNERTSIEEQGFVEVRTNLGQEPAAEEQEITAEEQETAAEEQEITAEEQETAAEEQEITAEEQETAAEERGTAAEEQEIAVEQETATEEQEKAVEQETAMEEQETGAEEPVRAAKEQETTAEELEVAAEEQVIAAEEQETAAEEREIAVEVHEAAAEEQETAAGEWETAVEEQKMAADLITKLAQAVDPKTLSQTSIDTMKMLGSLHWSQLEVLCRIMYGDICALGKSLCANLNRKYLDFRFHSFIPSKEFETFAVPADGNCLFNSLALLQLRDERQGQFMRLLVACGSVLSLNVFVNLIMKRYGQNVSTLLVEAASENDEIFPLGNDVLTVTAAVKLLVQEMLKKPFVDCGLFHIELAAVVLGHPILQHCHVKQPKYNLCRRLILPAGLTASKIAALNLVWVPTRPPHGRVSHIVPAICKSNGPLLLWRSKCGMLSLARCLHFEQEAEKPMVQCDRCDQWFHFECVGVEEEDVKGRAATWFCGCSDICSAQVSINLATYSNLERVQAITKKLSYKKVRRQAMAYACSNRQFVETSYGPFKEHVIDWLRNDIRLNEKPMNLDCEHAYVHEVLVNVVSQIENVARFPAEAILAGLFIGKV